ncbi:MAG: hypothetical protein JNM68_05770 [Dinghuibacter sp.]|nr:hypothetical protein [Dinghuibacter sp.]
MTNKILSCFVCCALFFFACGVSNSKPGTANSYPGFQLYYSYAGLGSNMGGMYPVFRVTGNNYTYTNEQNSYYGKPDKKPEFVCSGQLRNSSIDSILQLAGQVPDTLVYSTTPGVLSGGIHHISINYNQKKLTYTLHNAYDSVAAKIVHILNTNIPDGKNRLWLFTAN